MESKKSLYYLNGTTCVAGGIMIEEKKTPLDLMDDIYSLAYWMTGSEKSASDLLNSVYLNVDIASSEMEIIKNVQNLLF
ncbi:hypothetical protein [Chlorobaculum limnaeum]|uniref:hypothetical protein n=1 Tax=Chlorobaculum limnaeum TaxID=274537 RepID=UPI001F23A17A|nr:hypothetical protein [Chlorobaculum limnaeum]